MDDAVIYSEAMAFPVILEHCIFSTYALVADKVGTMIVLPVTVE
jgi:hypothetical protein